MTRLDALTMTEHDARQYLHRKLAELAALVESADHQVSVGQHVSASAIVAKARAVDEAQELWEATKVALVRHGIGQAEAV